MHRVSQSNEEGEASARQEPAAELDPENVALQEAAGCSRVRGPQKRRVHGDGQLAVRVWGPCSVWDDGKLQKCSVVMAAQGRKCTSCQCRVHLGVASSEFYATCISSEADTKGRGVRDRKGL